MMKTSLISGASDSTAALLYRGPSQHSPPVFPVAVRHALPPDIPCGVDALLSGHLCPGYSGSSGSGKGQRFHRTRRRKTDVRVSVFSRRGLWAWTPHADSNILFSGDYLTGTFCYCEYPPEMEEVMGPAHFYQFEYYNKHHDTTFIVTSACPDGDIGFDITCVPPNGGKYVLAGNTMDLDCKAWAGYETVDEQKVKREDEFCYMPHYKHGVDYISFNGQKRNLDPRGHQGARFERSLEPEICESLCQENMDMAMLKDDSFPPSHQVEWTKLDDMCDDCK